MARVTYGESITEYAGSIGGVTFHKNTSGNVARLRPNPTVNPTSLQAGYQTNMAKLVAFWPTLSQGDKTSWDALAAAHDHTTPWGETKTLNGFQWFLSCNLTRLLLLNPILSTAPVWSTISPVAAFTIQTSATYIRLYWSPALTGSYYILLYSTLPLRQSSLKLRRSLFYTTVKISIPDFDYWDFTSEYEALTGITWADFYSSADASIIVRVKRVYLPKGLSSAYTSAIVKIG